MKLSATQPNLRHGLGLVSRVVGNAATLPVLAHVLLETDRGRLRLSATDLELGIITYVGAKVETDGAITVPARTFTDFINSNTDERLNISTNQNSLTIISDSYKADIPGIAATEYPTIPTIEKGISFVVNRDELIRALKAVVIACALDEARPALAGVLWRGGDKMLQLAATDSFRLAEYIIALPMTPEGLNVIVPARAINEFIRVISAENFDQVQVVINNNQIQLTIGDTTIISRLIEASFPEYAKIIPQTFVTDLVVNASEMSNALKVATVFSSAQANNVQLTIEDQTVRLQSVASQYGQEVSAVNAEVMHHTEEKKLDITFNARYLNDVMTVAGPGKVIIKCSGATKPAVVVNPDLPNYQHIVMPIRVGA